MAPFVLVTGYGPAGLQAPVLRSAPYLG
jgi:hypothetical protein